jgi:hypothetical protein
MKRPCIQEAEVYSSSAQIPASILRDARDVE